jgi:hypothetical protein
MNELFGNVCLTKPEAIKIDAFLAERLTHAPEADQPAIQRIQAHLQRIIQPERQYADMSVYDAPGYEPGWKPAA